MEVEVYFYYEVDFQALFVTDQTRHTQSCARYESLPRSPHNLLSEAFVWYVTLRASVAIKAIT